MLGWRKIVAGGFFVSLITGCATMLPHYRLSNDYTQTLGVQSAIFETCANHGHWDDGISYQFSYGVTELLDVAVAEKSLYEGSYSETIRGIKRESASKIERECSSLEKHVPIALNRLNDAYQSAVEARSAGFSSMSSALSDFNRSMQAFNNSMAMQNSNIYLPNTQPDFNTSQQQNPKHYLISTPQGQQRCTRISSGYVKCY